MAQSLCYLKGTGTVVLCCHEDQVLHVADIEDKDRASLIAELERREELCDGTVKELKQKLEGCLLERQRIYQSQLKRGDIVHLDQDIKPSSIRVLKCL